MIPWRVKHCAAEIRKVFRPFDVNGDERDNALMQALMPALLDENSNGIDIGSHKGDFLDAFLRLAPQGHHVAIEPLPHLATRLRERYPMATVHEVALSNAAGSATFHHVTSGPGLSGLKPTIYRTPQSVEKIEVRTARLDDLIPEDQQIALIKLDVEGAELQVLQGAARTIQRWRPAIFIEHGFATADAYGTTPRDLHALLRTYGLRVFSLDGAGPHSGDGLAERCSPPERPREWNFLAKR